MKRKLLNIEKPVVEWLKASKVFTIEEMMEHFNYSKKEALHKLCVLHIKEQINFMYNDGKFFMC